MIKSGLSLVATTLIASTALAADLTDLGEKTWQEYNGSGGWSESSWICRKGFDLHRMIDQNSVKDSVNYFLNNCQSLSESTWGLQKGRTNGTYRLIIQPKDSKNQISVELKPK